MDQGLSEFQQEVLKNLGHLSVKMENVSTKMDFLVGPDGTNGRVGQLETDVNSMKMSLAGRRGETRAVRHLKTVALSLFSSVLGGGIEWFLNRR